MGFDRSSEYASRKQNFGGPDVFILECFTHKFYGLAYRDVSEHTAPIEGCKLSIHWVLIVLDYISEINRIGNCILKTKIRDRSTLHP